MVPKAKASLRTDVANQPKTKNVNSRDLVQSPSNVRPHVVLLGAGASLAAFPLGDRSGRSLPLMNNLVDTVGLKLLIERLAGKEHQDENFENIYSKLTMDPRHENSLKEIEEKVRNYFSSLRITTEATIYDFLLLSLREKDAIFTFNWDPLLFDAYKRNAHISKLPSIFFLHGNVRIGVCPSHANVWGERQSFCNMCSRELTDVPLLFPVRGKNYTLHRYIKRCWEEANFYFAEAFVLTIFGYGAPVSDTAAVDLLQTAWTSRSERRIEHVEIIDVLPSSVLYERWRDFTPTGHLRQLPTVWDSWLMRYPRRTVESLMYPVHHGEPAEVFPLVQTEHLRQVQKQALKISAWEKKPPSSTLP